MSCLAVSLGLVVEEHQLQRASEFACPFGIHFLREHSCIKLALVSRCPLSQMPTAPCQRPMLTSHADRGMENDLGPASL